MRIKICATICLAMLSWYRYVEAGTDFIDVRNRLDEDRNTGGEGSTEKYFRKWRLLSMIGTSTNAPMQMNLRQ